MNYILISSLHMMYNVTRQIKLIQCVLQGLSMFLSRLFSIHVSCSINICDTFALSSGAIKKVLFVSELFYDCTFVFQKLSLTTIILMKQNHLPLLSIFDSYSIPITNYFDYINDSKYKQYNNLLS